MPGMCSGDIISAIAMTEPGAGSDLQGVRTTAVADGDDFIINGSKTYITNGYHSDMVIVVAKTEPEKGAHGVSLLLVDADMEGFQKGRKLKKLGLKAQDTSELFFDNVRVPKENVLGGDAGYNKGFYLLMSELPQERLLIADMAVAAAEACFEWTRDYVRDRKAFGKTILDLQTTKHKLSEIKTELSVCRSFVDDCLELHNVSEGQGLLAACTCWSRVSRGSSLTSSQSAPVVLALLHCIARGTHIATLPPSRVHVLRVARVCHTQEEKLDSQMASMAKYYATDLQCSAVDRCLQLHGGAGFMLEYGVARMFADARVQPIYGGANEIMKELIARSL